MDKNLIARIAALKAVVASEDPKNIAQMTDAVGDENPDIQGLVEKIMAKMDAKDGSGKFHLAANKRKALKVVATLIQKAFGDEMGGELPPAPGGPLPQPTPMDKALGETPASEAADMGNPAIAPIEKMEQENTGDPILEALLSVVEMIMKKEFGGDDKEEGAGSPPPFAKKEEGGSEKSDSAPAPKSESKKPSFPPEKEESEEEPESESEEEKPEPKEENIEAEAELYLLRKKIDASKAELSALGRIKSLLSLPKEARLAKAASYRKLAEAVEKGEMPDFESIDKADKEDEKDMDKTALKKALVSLVAALEAGENDKKYTQAAAPQEEADLAKEVDSERNKERKEDEASPLDKEASRKDLVLAHLAKLRIQKQANTESQPTPKQVPKPIGTVEDNDKGDAKIQYSPATADVNLGEIQTKKQKLPTDKGPTAGEANEIFQGNDSEAAQTIQTVPDSTKDVNNKKKLPDMGTAVQPDHPVSPTEYERGAGSHQNAKEWEKAKSESDTTPTGPRLKGLAQEIAKRAITLARLAESKGMIATAEQFDELVDKYSSYDEIKLAAVEEVLNDAPSRNVRKAQDATFVENDAVEEAEEGQPETPSVKHEIASAREPKAITRRASVDDEQAPISGLKRPLVMGESNNLSKGRFAALKNLDWSGPTSEPEND